MLRYYVDNETQPGLSIDLLLGHGVGWLNNSLVDEGTIVKKKKKKRRGGRKQKETKKGQPGVKD